MNILHKNVSSAHGKQARKECKLEHFFSSDNVSGYVVVFNFHGKWFGIESFTLVKDTSTCVSYKSGRKTGEIEENSGFIREKSASSFNTGPTRDNPYWTSRRDHFRTYTCIQRKLD